MTVSPESLAVQALAAKEALLSSITIYRKDGPYDQLIRLNYEPRNLRREG